ncbi:hypothetical protein [Rubritalea squalenifaciens]|nr:hypothetical protein [Rubritalea squalenifaciens]
MKSICTMKEEYEQQRQEWIHQAEIILGSGQGHIAVINYLRSQGMSHDNAKAISYDIFDCARRKLMRSQFPLIFSAYVMMFVGIFVPIALFLVRSPLAFVSAPPFIAGIVLHYKVIRPSRLPQ